LGTPGEFTDQKRVFANHQEEDSDVSEDTRKRLADDRYRRSFYARSQEIIFLKANLGTWQERPVSSSPIIMFPDGDWNKTEKITRVIDGQEREVVQKNQHDVLGVVRMQEWDLPSTMTKTGDPRTAYRVREKGVGPTKTVPVVVSPGTMLVPNGTGVDLVQMRWDTISDPSVKEIDPEATGDAFHDTIEIHDGQPARVRPDRLREYGYAVTTSPFGAGRLVRVYTRLATQGGSVSAVADVGSIIGRSADREVIVDRVLSDRVTRIVFDTFRTVSEGLGHNQVRVRLYMVGTPRDAKVAPMLKAERVLTMRTINTTVDNERIKSSLGSTTSDAPGFFAPFPH
jgi:hypothetical protein